MSLRTGFGVGSGECALEGARQWGAAWPPVPQERAGVALWVSSLNRQQPLPAMLEWVQAVFGQFLLLQNLQQEESVLALWWPARANVHVADNIFFFNTLKI